jgi:hypothetical protein
VYSIKNAVLPSGIELGGLDMILRGLQKQACPSRLIREGIKKFVVLFERSLHRT